MINKAYGLYAVKIMGCGAVSDLAQLCRSAELGDLDFGHNQSYV